MPRLFKYKKFPFKFKFNIREIIKGCFKTQWIHNETEKP